MRDNNHKWQLFLKSTISVLVVVIAASAIFAFRYQPAFTDSNFYAEDGKEFMETTIEKDQISTLFTKFDGIFVVGQYILTNTAELVQSLFSIHFYQLPVILAILSCLFLGLTVSLPFILFRRKLGIPIALVMVFFGAFTPLPSSDYAIIGTIGNLKFAFLYWAFMFILYRIHNSNNLRKVMTSDFFIVYFFQDSR